MKRSDIALWAAALILAPTLWPSAGRAGTAADDYQNYCAQCHGTMGTGQGINETAGGLSVSPRSHINAEEMSKLSDEDLRLGIAEGGDALQKSGLMPPWGKTLSSENIDELVIYLRKLCKCEGKQ